MFNVKEKIIKYTFDFIFMQYYNGNYIEEISFKEADHEHRNYWRDGV
jgi:hypothetical protein